MFGTLGGPEILLLLVLALIVFGPRKLPEIGKSMGKMLAEFRRASNDFRRTIEDEVEAEKMRAAIADEPARAPLAAPAAEADAAPAALPGTDTAPVPPPQGDVPAHPEAVHPDPGATAPVLSPPAESVHRD
jgi:Tat protein translocase TatB subunit